MIVRVFVTLASLAATLLTAAACLGPPRWTQRELDTLASLSLAGLPPLPTDPSNAVADDPRAAALGERLFNDPGLSANRQVSCATCHREALHFTDGLPRAHGLDDFHRHTMTLLGSSYSMWQTWDGKADSQWMQALLPLENPAEHGLDRAAIAHRIAQTYAGEYEMIFGELPALHETERFPAHAGPIGDETTRNAWEEMAPSDRAEIDGVFANVGKVIAAYERTLLPEPSRFDHYVDAARIGSARQMSALFSAEEVAGLRLFLGKGRCMQCHNGPLFSNFEFHNTAAPPVPGLPLDHGRADALHTLQASEFNCLGPHSDATPEECAGLRFLVTDGPTFDGAFRTPTLRNVAETAPYMHAGQFATLEGVVRHYNQGGLQLLGHNELSPLGLSEVEERHLVAFLRTLTAKGPDE